MSTRNLGPMFHGTFQEFQPGDVIASPAARGEENPRPNNIYYRPNQVYFSPHYQVAEQFATKLNDDGYEYGHVYEVEPIGRKQQDEEAIAMRTPKGTSLRAESARVIRRVMPGETVKRTITDYSEGIPKPKVVEGKAI